jgi:hypothetical protein
MLTHIPYVFIKCFMKRYTPLVPYCQCLGYFPGLRVGRERDVRRHAPCIKRERTKLLVTFTSVLALDYVSPLLSLFYAIFLDTELERHEDA